MTDRLEDLLRDCTVRVTGGRAPGAGFFVAPGMVLTCAHVIRDSTELAVHWERDGRPALEIPVSGRFVLAGRGRPIPALDADYPDIAVLEIGELDGHPCVGIDLGWPFSRDSFQVFGYPEEGRAVRLTPAGLAYRGTHGTAPTAYLDLGSDTIKPGMSGAAVLNLRTGMVCGVVVASKHVARPDGALAVPWSAIEEDLREVLAANRAFHLRDRRWDTAAAGDREQALPSPALVISRPAQLPRIIGDFTGRAEDLRKLGSLLDKRNPEVPDAIVISALAGQGGVGKTALAVYLAHKYRPDFPDGQLYTDLRGMGSSEQSLNPADVLADFLRSLGIDSANIPGSLDERAALYRSRLDGQRVLILLDNAASDRQVEPLLPASGGCAVLVTSRSSLTLAGAEYLRLGVMDKPDAMRFLGRLVPRDLIEAAPADAEAIVDLCGYLPLAIRIAGARVRDSGDLSGYRQELAGKSTRLAALSYGDLDLRASLGLSYDHGLSPGAQRAFRLLGIIGAPTFPSWVAAALLGESLPQTHGILGELRRAQLLESTGRDSAGHIRFRFHDLVRDLARELLRDTEKAEAIERLIAACTALAGRAHALLEPPDPGDDTEDDDRALPDCVSEAVAAMNRDWLAWFSDDRQIFLDVISTASQQGLWAATVRLCELVTTLVEVPSYWDDWSQISDIALRASRRAGMRAAEARTLRHLGDLRVYQGQRPEAEVHLQESVDIFRDQGNEAGEAASLIRLGEVQRLTGNAAGALESMECGRVIYHRLGNELGVAYALTSIGGALRVRGRWNESIDAFLQCIPLLKAAGRRRQAAIALISLGDVYHLKSMWAEAYHCFDECHALFTSLGDLMWVQNTRRHIGIVHVILGRTDDAMAYFSEALTTFGQIGDRRKEALTHWAIGDAHAHEERLIESLASYQIALSVFKDIRDRFCQAHVLREMATVGIRLHDARTQSWVDASIAVAQTLDDELVWAKAQIGLAELLHFQNQSEQAITIAKGSLATFRQRGDRLWQAKALTQLGALYIDHADAARARDALTEAMRTYQDISVSVPAELKTMLAAIG